jgi:hypothetical protein
MILFEIHFWFEKNKMRLFASAKIKKGWNQEARIKMNAASWCLMMALFQGIRSPKT